MRVHLETTENSEGALTVGQSSNNIRNPLHQQTATERKQNERRRGRGEERETKREEERERGRERNKKEYILEQHKL